MERNTGNQPVVIEAMNQISGVYAAQFWKAVYGQTESLPIMDDICFLLHGFEDADDYSRGIRFIQIFHDMLAFELPVEWKLIITIPELTESFYHGFVADMEDIRSDYDR